jgi:hypothetical protein
VNDNNNSKPLAGELLWEVADIAAELGLPERAAYHLLRTRALPARKIGGKWVSSRAGLRRCFAPILGAEDA